MNPGPYSRKPETYAQIPTLRFFGNHSLPYRAIPGVELTFEIWENASGKAQARQLGSSWGRLDFREQPLRSCKLRDFGFATGAFADFRFEVQRFG